ncbi:hypothetical protein ACQY0O_003639 [Thecaphora frezii]
MSNATTLELFQPCPPGLAASNGTVCDTATCASTFVAPDKRPAKPSGDKQCSTCDTGFTGVNCNVCVGANSCQARRLSSEGTTSTASSTQSGDSALVCHSQPDTIHTTYIDCVVEQPTIQAVFPGTLEMAMTKVGTPEDFTATGVAPWSQQANSTLATVFYEGVEQFYCQATGCTFSNATRSATLGKSRFGTTDTTCQNLHCYCIPGTTMCGGGTLDLTPVINGLSGNLSMPCDYVDPAAVSSGANATGDCAFRGDLLTSLFGDEGLPLKQCRYGSCVTQGDLHAFWQTEANSSGASSNGDKLSGPLKGGLAVLAVVVAGLLGALAFGFWRRRKAAQRPRDFDGSSVGIVWKDIHYGLISRGAKRNVFSRSAASNEKVATASDDHTTVVKLGNYDPNHILKSVSGRIEPGQMVAVLGPSGAGKSTLVDILAGRAKSGKVSGEIAFAFADAGRSGSHVGGMSPRTIAFVDQDDALPAHSTVREALRMAADLSLPENVPTNEKVALVNHVINLLGLSQVADRRIGDHRRRGVSGGERRRVSIGCALVARPKILIADEPLSGLDAFSASRVISAFRDLARGPVAGSTTVIMTLHQPSSEIFHSYDTVILMTSGRAIYKGPPSECMDWCREQGDVCPPGHNVADHLLKIAFDPEKQGAFSLEYNAPKTSGHLSDDGAAWTSAQASAAVVIAAGTPAGPAWARVTGNAPCTTFMTQLATLSERARIIALRDRAGPLAHLVGAVVFGLVTGGCFYQVDLTIAGFQNRVGSMYFLLILLCFAAMSACTTLARDRPLMVRERSNGLYGPTAWILSFVLFDAVLLRLIPTVLITTIIYWMVGLKPDAGFFFEFVLIAFLFHESVALYNMILASVIEDLSVAILVAGTSILFNIGYGGFLLNLDQIPAVLRWLQWLCPLKYALEAVSTHELKGLQLVDKVAGVNISTSVSLFSGSLFGFRDGAFYRDLLVLALGFNLGCFVLLCGAVWWKMRDVR